MTCKVVDPVLDDKSDGLHVMLCERRKNLAVLRVRSREIIDGHGDAAGLGRSHKTEEE